MGLTRNLTRNLTMGLTSGLTGSDVISFVLTVKTDNTGTSSSDQFAFPLVSGGTYNFIAKSSDGTTKTITDYTDNVMTFDSGAGTYTITVTGTLNGWTFNDGGDKDKLLSISQWGILDGIQAGGFRGCSNLTIITASDYPRFLATATTADINSLFFNCTSLTHIEGVENWTALNTTNVSAMFFNAPINQNVAKLITSNVISANNFIRGTNIDQDLSAMDFSSITSATNFALGTSMSTANYDALLNSLASQSLQSAVILSFGAATYTGFSTAGTAHSKLVNQYSWTLIDGGASIDATTIRWYDTYDEITITDVAGAVSSIADKSTVGDDATQSTGGKEPTTGTTTINSRNTLYFDGTNSFLNITTSFDFMDATVLMVVERDETSRTDMLMGGAGINTQLRFTSTDNSNVAAAANPWISGGGAGQVGSLYSFAAATPYVVGFQGDELLQFIQNSTIQERGISRVNTNPFLMGEIGSYNGGAAPFKGKIGEIIVFSSVLTGSTLTDKIDYLKEKWGIV